MAEAPQPIADQPVVAQIEPDKPIAAEPEIATAETVELQAPTPARKVNRRATKASPGSAAKERPAKQPAGVSQSFGEHTPAFMLRPVKVA